MSRPVHTPRMQSPALTAEWSVYWAAMRSGDVDAMARTYSRIERLQLAETSRRTTVRMLAQVDAALHPGA